VLRQYALWNSIPDVVRGFLEDGLAGRVPETAKPGDPAFDRARAEIIASNGTFLDAVCEQARHVGLQVVLQDGSMIGEARETGRRFGERVAALAEDATARTLIVAGGETTVTVRGTGQGGRNQEFALAAAQAIAGAQDVQIAAHATDGTDGTTDAAGAIVDGQTIARGKALGLDPGGVLENNSSHDFLTATGDLLWTGPTGTNVADIALGLIDGC